MSQPGVMEERSERQRRNISLACDRNPKRRAVSRVIEGSTLRQRDDKHAAGVLRC